MANEYVFFDEALGRRFIGFAAEHGLEGSIRPDEIEGYIVALPDEIDDERYDALEAEYDLMMEEQRRLVDAADGDDARHAMGVTITLPDGQSCLVRLPADYGRRLCEHFSPQEIHDLVTAIANEIANPASGPLCCSV